MMRFIPNNDIIRDKNSKLAFKDYIKFERENYEPVAVEKNFYKVLDHLGELDKNETIAAITLRLKGKADWRTANEVANGFEFRVSRKFWGRKSRYKKLPMVFAIESSRKWDKDHLHGLIRIQDPKQPYTEQDIIKILKETSHSFNEVNKRDPDAVITRIFPFCEDITKQLGNSIEYICKTSSRHYDPLQRKLTHRAPNEYQFSKKTT
jgi:hypothetical protein